MRLSENCSESTPPVAHLAHNAGMAAWSIKLQACWINGFSGRLIQRQFESLVWRNYAHGRQPENVVDEHFAALRFAGRNLRCRCHTNHLSDDISCLGSKDVTGVCWLPELTERQPKLRELQAVHPTVLLQTR
jgi:hypothetical protein